MPQALAEPLEQASQDLGCCFGVRAALSWIKNSLSLARSFSLSLFLSLSLSFLNSERTRLPLTKLCCMRYHQGLVVRDILDCMWAVLTGRSSL